MSASEARPPVGAVVGWVAPVTSATLGLNANAPRAERIGRVSHYRPGGELVAHDPDGMRCVLAPESVYVLAERAEAGWANLLGGAA